MPTINHLLISTGDASAAHHAADLIRAIKAAHPDIRITAVGNDDMRNAGADLFAHHDDIGMGGWGVAEAVKSAVSHYQLAFRLKQFIQKEHVDRVLLIDYSGFHIRLAKLIAPVCDDVRYYIPPQLWASRAGRMKIIKKYISHVYTIFPFEEALYTHAGVPNTFVGHPLLKQLPPPISKEAFCAKHDLDPHAPLLGLFPGSRKSEINRLLQDFVDACGLAHHAASIENKSLQIVIAKAPHLDSAYFSKQLQTAFADHPTLPYRVLEHQNHAILSASDVILGASGTTSLEAALYNTPMIIAYRVDAFTAFLSRRLLLVKYIGLPNLLVDPEDAPILPEFLQEECTPEALAKEIQIFLGPEHPRTHKALAGLSTVQATLGNGVSTQQFVEHLIALS